MNSLNDRMHLYERSDQLADLRAQDLGHLVAAFDEDEFGEDHEHAAWIDDSGVSDWARQDEQAADARQAYLDIHYARQAEIASRVAGGSSSSSRSVVVEESGRDDNASESGSASD